MGTTLVLLWAMLWEVQTKHQLQRWGLQHQWAPWLRAPATLHGLSLQFCYALHNIKSSLHREACASLQGQQYDREYNLHIRIPHLQAQGVIATVPAGRHLPAFPQNHGGYEHHDSGGQRHKQALQDSERHNKNHTLKPHSAQWLGPSSAHDFDKAARSSSHHSLASEQGTLKIKLNYYSVPRDCLSSSFLIACPKKKLFLPREHIAVTHEKPQGSVMRLFTWKQCSVHPYRVKG